MSARLEAFPTGLEVSPPELAIQLSQRRIDSYAEASGDHNPIHLDPEFARQVGLPSTIAHGLLTMAAATAQIEWWAEPVAHVARTSCRFSAPVPSGDTVSGRPRLTGAAAGVATVELEALTAAGERALSRAEVELRRVQSLLRADRTGARR